MSAYLTGYTWYDNTPAGSAAIARPTIHHSAGGAGTFEDPITLAVAAPGGNWVFKPGTVFYVPMLQKYFVAEDTGDDFMAHPARGDAWLDLWMGGQGVGASKSNACAYAVTGVHDVIVNPSKGYAVASGYGVMSDQGCQMFDDAAPASVPTAAPAARADSSDEAAPAQVRAIAGVPGAQAPAPQPAQGVSTSTYTVKRGDTLTALAARFSTTVDQLVATNHIADPDMIIVGQVLTVPGVAQAAPTTPAAPAVALKAEAQTYTVRAGDTLSKIAREHHVAGGWEKLAQLNHDSIDDPDEIYVGQRFILV